MPTAIAEETVPSPPGDDKDAPNAAPVTKPLIGIIYPPPEVRNIVDKTASFVARNGPEFEARIRQNEINNPKFNFLNSGDPYNAYYQHKVKEFKEGKVPDSLNFQPPIPLLPGGHLQPPPVKSSIQQRQLEILKQVEQPIVLKDPPVEFEFIADPPSISAFDLDVVKLTAQFVARNGRQFLTNLMNREQRNYQFDFLRPQHSLFQYFTRLLEQYTKVLIPPKDLMKKLKDENSRPNVVLEQVRYRAEWIRHEEVQRRKEEEEAEKERVAYAQIDWHDFVVVEMVDYQPYEHGNFPPPTTPDDVGARVLLQERLDDGEDVEMQLESDDDDAYVPETKDNTQVQDMEEESSDEESDPSRPTSGKDEDGPPGVGKGSSQPALAAPISEKVIKRGYDPKITTVRTQRPAAVDEYLISPITGEKIPASKVQEHMRIGLLDPRWVEQRDRQIQDKMNQESVFAPGTAIEASLKQLAERRTDIFGVGDEETAIGKKIGEEDKKKDDKVTWDGHTSSVEAATRAARANITLEDQIHQIHKVKGLLPDEEKEKIGPKPVGGRTAGLAASAAASGISTLSAKPSAKTVMSIAGASIKAPPTIAKPAPLPQGPVAPAPLGAPSMHPMAPLMPQPGMMMVPSMAPHLRPPPHMMAFSVPSAGPPVPNYLPVPQAPQAPQPPPPASHPMKHGMDDDEPAHKRQRTEDNLIPEDQFLAKNPSHVTFKVSIPTSSEKPEWKLNGQVLNIGLQLSDSVSVLKAKLHEEIGMPPGKQKLQWEGLFFKDSNSLAYYNINPHSVVVLQVKERGGRKK